MSLETKIEHENLESIVTESMNKIKEDPNELEWFWDIAAEIIKWNEIETIENIYDYILELNPNQARTYRNKGWIISDIKKDVESALPYYKKATELDPNWGTGFHSLGYAYASLKMWNEAEIAERRALELIPEESETYSNLIQILYLSGKVKEKKHEEEVLKLVNKGLNLNEIGYLFYASAAYSLWQIKGERDKAIELYKKSIEKNKKYANPYENIGKILEEQEKYKEEESFLEESLKLFPDNTSMLYRLGWVKREIFEKHDAAEKIFEKYLSIDPNNANALNELGLIYLERDLDKARSTFNLAIEKNKNLVYPYYNLAKIATLEGNNREVFDLAILGLKVDNTHENLNKVVIQMGLTYFQEDFKEILNKLEDPSKNQIIIRELLSDNYKKVKEKLSVENYDEYIYNIIASYSKKNASKREFDSIAELLNKNDYRMKDSKVFDVFNSEVNLYEIAALSDNFEVPHMIKFFESIENGCLEDLLKEGFESDEKVDFFFASLFSLDYLETDIFEKYYEKSKKILGSDKVLNGIVQTLYLRNKEKYEEALEVLDSLKTKLPLPIIHEFKCYIHFNQERYSEALFDINKALERGCRGGLLRDRAIVKQILGYDIVDYLSDYIDGYSNLSNLDRKLCINSKKHNHFFKHILQENSNPIRIMKEVAYAKNENPQRRLNAITLLLPFMDKQEIISTYKEVFEAVVNSEIYINSLKRDKTVDSRNIIYTHLGNPLWDNGLVVKSSRHKTGKKELEKEFIANGYVESIMAEHDFLDAVGSPIGLFEYDKKDFLMIKRESKHVSKPTEKEAKNALKNLAMVHNLVSKEVYGKKSIEYQSNKLKIQQFNYIHNLERRFLSRFKKTKQLEDFARSYSEILLGLRNIDEKGNSLNNCFLHGDFFYTNVLEGGTIIDWERNPEGFVGNPMYDVMNYLSHPLFNEKRDELLQFYLSNVNVNFNILEQDAMFNNLQTSICHTATYLSRGDNLWKDFANQSYGAMKFYGLDELAEKFIKVLK